MRDENIAKKIVDSISADAAHALEIGPGTGVLTKYLLGRFPEFLALDVDRASIDYLKEHYPDDQHRFLLQDFLTYSLNEAPCLIIGNFPYHISSQIFFKIWEEKDKVDEVVCMIQKEVAERIAAKSGSKTYGILSVLLQAFYDIRYAFSVPPEVFQPPPKVQSAVITLKRNATTSLGCDEKLFKKVVKAGFGKRRKTLRNALKEINLPDSLRDDPLLNLRAEQLSVADFVFLTAKLSS